MDTRKTEIRTLPTGLHLACREAGDPAGAGRVIEGTAIVFNRESQVLDQDGAPFREVIRPEAVTQAWLSTQDVRLNLLHDRTMTIARSHTGDGGLKLSVDSEGVHFAFEAPRCDLGDRALELVRTGVYTGCSFEFFPQDYTIADTGDPECPYLVTHTRFRALLALTIGMDPAYRQTSVSARELTPSPAVPATDTARRSESRQALQRLRRRLREADF